MSSTPNGAAAGVLSRRKSRWSRQLWATATVALLLRLAFTAEMFALNGGHNSALTPAKSTDLATYITLAREFAAGAFHGPFYYQPFYYTVFLGPISFFLPGEAGIVAAALVQCLLGAATVLPAGLIAAQLFGRRAGIVAAVFTAISTPLLLYTPFHQNETLQCFNLTLLAYLTLRAMRTRRLRGWLAAGAVCGIAILTRGNVWLLVPALLGGIIVSLKKSRRAMAAALALFLAGTIIPQLPYAIHNSVVLGRLCGPSTAADAVLALGNTPEAPPGGRNPGLPAGPMEYPEAFHRAMHAAEKGFSVPRQMLDWLLTAPGSFLELQFRKLLLFWDFREIPNNVSLYGEGEHSTVLRLLLPGRSLVLLLLSVAGMLLVPRRRSSRCRVLLAMVILYWGAIALFYDLSRFRAPILPLAFVFGGAFVTTAVLRSRIRDAERRRHQLILLAGAFAAAAFLVCGANDFYRNNLESAVMRMVRPDGTTLTEHGPKVTFDHGPFSFGGWRAVELKQGMTFGKDFAVGDEAGTLLWQLQAEQPGTLLIDFNGRAVVQQLAAGENRLKLEGAGRSNTIAILRCPEGVCAIGDCQRDYGRSTLDGQRFHGEWVMRLESAARD